MLVNILSSPSPTAVITVRLVTLTINAILSTMTSESLIPFCEALSTPPWRRSFCSADNRILRLASRSLACFEKRSSAVCACFSSKIWRNDAPAGWETFTGFALPVVAIAGLLTMVVLFSEVLAVTGTVEIIVLSVSVGIVFVFNIRHVYWKW